MHVHLTVYLIRIALTSAEWAGRFHFSRFTRRLSIGDAILVLFSYVLNAGMSIFWHETLTSTVLEPPKS